MIACQSFSRCAVRNVAPLVRLVAKLALAFSAFAVLSSLVLIASYLCSPWQLLFSHTLWLASVAGAVAVAGFVVAWVVDGIPRWALVILFLFCAIGTFGELVWKSPPLAGGLVLGSSFLGALLGSYLSGRNSRRQRYVKLAQLVGFLAVCTATWAGFVVAAAFVDQLVGPGSAAMQAVFSWRLAQLLLAPPTVWSGAIREELLIGFLAFPLAAGVSFLATKGSAEEHRLSAPWALGTCVALLWLGRRWWTLHEIALMNPAVLGARNFFYLWLLATVTFLGVGLWRIRRSA